jgi:hypothetical protein
MTFPSLLAAAFALLVSGAAISSEADGRQTIVSVRVLGEHVFASTDAGLYRASLKEKDWQRLSGPESGGRLVAGGPNEKALFYFVTDAGQKPEPGQSKRKIVRPGLYRSSDAGESWECQNSAHDFASIMRLPGGRMFATVRSPNGEDDLVLLSEDHGRSWKDITLGAVQGERWLILQRDPDHPTRVCLYAPFLMRRGGTIFNAADDRFRWKICYSGLDAYEWPGDEKKWPDEFFASHRLPGYRLQWPAGTIERLLDLPDELFGKAHHAISVVGSFRARLDNYFKYPFGENASLPHFDVVTEKPAYEFRPGPLRVAVSIVQYDDSARAYTLPLLADAKDVTRFWGINVIDPTGKKTRVRPAGDPLGHFADEKKTLTKTPDAWRFQLTPDKPARRTIDLRDLYRFPHPGEYKVQLVYACWGWRDERGVVRTLDAVAGQVFSVTIKR